VNAVWADKIPLEFQDRIDPGRPEWVRPMLARLHEGPMPPGDWVFERKFDGQRVSAFCDPDTMRGVRLVTRNGLEVTGRYPELLHALPPDRAFVVDAEIVAFEDDHDSFELLQRRMHRKDPDLDVEVSLLIFDILNLDWQDVRRLPMVHRRPLIHELELHGPVAPVPYTKGDPKRLLERACQAGWEGLVAKRPDAPYQCRRSDDWLKLKCLRRSEFRIGGFTAPRGTRSGFGALLLGEETEAGLRYVGKVGTGFDERALRLIHGGLNRILREDPPFLDPPSAPAQWVDPVLICRVEYKERTREGRLRHPRFLGLMSPGVRRAIH
jgi:bifunctional non-homologous end joining protein LigD